MSKPILSVEIKTVDGAMRGVQSLFDSGSHYTLIRADCIPASALITMYPVPRQFGLARRGAKISATGVIPLEYHIGDKSVEHQALVVPELSQELIIGAGMMQEWDISIVNVNGHTEVRVGHDMNDPDIQEID